MKRSFTLIIGTFILGLFVLTGVSIWSQGNVSHKVKQQMIVDNAFFETIKHAESLIQKISITVSDMFNANNLNELHAYEETANTLFIEYEEQVLFLQKKTI